MTCTLPIPSKHIGLIVLLSCVVASPLAAQEVLRQVPGAAPGERFGSRLISADLDGDAVLDTVVGVPGGGLLPEAGVVRAVSGADGALLWEMPGALAGDRFGQALARVPDVDGDGRDEVLVGAPGGPSSNAAGSVHMLSGATGSGLWSKTGAQPGDQFGYSVATTGPLLTDEDHGVIVGAPMEDAGGADSGAVHFLAADDGSAVHAIAGNQAGDLFGHSVACAVDGALAIDDDMGVVVGAPQIGMTDTGYAQSIDPMTMTVAWSVSGSQGGDRLGHAVTALGDIDGDGVTDAAIAGNPSDARPGSVRVVSGADGVELRSHTGVDPDAGFGRVVAAVGDVDGDGMPDLGVAEPFADATQQDVGCLLVYSGSDGTLLHRIFGDLGGSGFGSGLASAGDVDGDGRADITVGIPADGVSAGAVVVLSLGPWENLGAGLPGVNGIPDLTGQTGSIETDVELTLSGARGASAATLVVGYSTYVDLQHGVLSPMPDLVVNGLVTTSQGEVQLTFEWPEEAASGDKVYYQFRVLDPEAPGGESRSHAISGLIP